MGINVGPGNQRHSPEPPVARQPHWRLTWIAIAAFLLLVLVFVAVSRMRGSQDSAYTPGETKQEQRQQPAQPESRPR